MASVDVAKQHDLEMLPTIHSKPRRSKFPLKSKKFINIAPPTFQSGLNRPHPNLAYHFKGLQDFPVCTVRSNVAPLAKSCEDLRQSDAFPDDKSATAPSDGHLEATNPAPSVWNGKYPDHRKFVRHRPHPKYAMHMRGLLDAPIRVIRGNTPAVPLMSAQPTRRSASATTLSDLYLRQIPPTRDRAMPTIGMVPVPELWRNELRSITESVLLPLCDNNYEQLREVIDVPRHPYPHNRPVTVLSQTAADAAEREIAVSRCSAHSSRSAPTVRSTSSAATASLALPPIIEEATQPQNLSVHNNNAYLNHLLKQNRSQQMKCEDQIFNILCQILKLDNLSSIKSWLMSATEAEKSSVINLVSKAFVSSLDSELKLRHDDIEEERRGGDSNAVDILNVDEERKHSEEQLDRELPEMSGSEVYRSTLEHLGMLSKPANSSDYQDVVEAAYNTTTSNSVHGSASPYRGVAHSSRPSTSASSIGWQKQIRPSTSQTPQNAHGAASRAGSRLSKALSLEPECDGDAPLNSALHRKMQIYKQLPCQ